MQYTNVLNNLLQKQYNLNQPYQIYSIHNLKYKYHIPILIKI